MFKLSRLRGKVQIGDGRPFTLRRRVLVRGGKPSMWPNADSTAVKLRMPDRGGGGEGHPGSS